MEDKVYDLCIVGAGLIGSAAARHASETSGRNVCLVGPSEPTDRSSATDRDIYGAYYDEGRITRCCDPDPVWANLALESIKRYRDIERQSGINFYHEVGNLMVGSGADSKYITAIKSAAHACKVDVKWLNSGNIRQQYPFLKFPKDAQAVQEVQNAGFINPRRLVEAQIKLASRQGCTVIDDVVRKVERIVQSDGIYVMRVETESSRVVFARSVLLATGAFTRFRNLLPSDIQVQHAITAISVALVEVSLEDNDNRSLSNMPCILYNGRGHEDWLIPDLYKNYADIYFYLLPPIKYPDGRYYVKLGFIDLNGKKVETRTDMKRWYDEGDIAFQEKVAKFIGSIFEGIKLLSWKGDSCAIMDTPTARPYVEKVHDQLGVVIGGNGYAAKSSDEIGRLGACMMLNGWNSELPEEVFKIKYCNNSKL